jgi:hypothetical protein
MEIRCPVIVDGKPCDGKLVMQELEDNKLGPIGVYVCEDGHRPLFEPRTKSGKSILE